MDALKVFAANLKKYRKERGLSQEAFPEKVGLHRTYISALEREKRNISIDNIQKIADALEIDTYKLLVDYLLHQTVSPFMEKNNQCRILDPACGSGIFLVESARKLIETNILQNSSDISDNKLINIVVDNLTGIVPSTYISSHNLKENELIVLTHAFANCSSVIANATVERDK